VGAQMLFRGYFKVRDVLLKKFLAREAKMNQEISIHDLIVYLKPSQSKGESKVGGDSHRARTRRMLDHIKLLARIANTHHQQSFCDTTCPTKPVLKPDCLNNITRISLNEFSFYSQHPFNTANLHNFVKEVYAIARQQQPNVHLLLSSFPVITQDNRLLNMSLYVECGDNPKITTFCKGRYSTVDQGYAGVGFFRQQDQASDETVSPFIAGDKGFVVSNNTVFPVTTAGGAEYVQTVDVCLDHNFQHSKKIMENAAAVDVSHDSSLIPAQVDQILTSNYIFINKEAKLVRSVVHVDPWLSKKPAQEVLLSESCLQNFKDAKYPEMSLSKNGNYITVTNPPFGATFKVGALAPRKLAHFSGKLKEVIDRRNIKVRNHTPDLHLSSIIQYSELFDFSKKTFYADLSANLLSICKGEFLEVLFNTNSYRLKNKVSAFITRAYKLLDESHISVMELFLKDLKRNLAFLDDGTQPKLFKKLALSISDAEAALNQQLPATVQLKR
jgi:hypothetical protein